LAVAGGGVTGLAAAHRLSQLLPDAELQVFESGPRLGGALHTERRGDRVLEHGADSFLTRDPVAVELCRELGLADELLPTNAEHRRALVVCRGRLEPVPAGFVLMRADKLGAVLRSPILSLGGKLRLWRERFVRAPADAASPDYDESVASFATRRLGRETFERLVEPLVAGIYVADAVELSLAATMPEFLAAEREHGSLAAARGIQSGSFRPPSLGGSNEHGRRWRPSAGGSPCEAPGWGGEISAVQTATHSAASPLPSPPRQGEGTGQVAGTGARYQAFLTLRSGMSRLVETLAAQLPAESVRLATPIAGLAKTGSARWQVATAAGNPEEFDGVILATPARRTAPLIEPFDSQLACSLDQIPAASSVVITLLYGREQLPRPFDAFGFVVPRIEGRPILAGSFPSVKFPGRGTAEMTPIRVFLGGALRPDLIERDDGELVAIAERELADLLGARGAPREAIVARWPESMPQYRVGHLALVSAIEKQVSEHRGLELAGASYRGVGIPQCIRSGRSAAERLAACLPASR
jgi:oxygen-dependent protoporphyrinogen oxidase